MDGSIRKNKSSIKKLNIIYIYINIYIYVIQYENIIILSLPRTGFTMLYNIIKLLFENINISKEHAKFNKLDDFNKIIEDNNLILVTLRNPYDSITSILLIKEQKIKNNNIKSL